MEGPPDFFLTFAEVAVSLAGFASLLMAIRRMDSDKWFPEGIGVLATIGWSLGALFLSLLPFVLFSLNLPESGVWSVSSGILAFFIIAFSIGLSISARRLNFDIPKPAKVVRLLILSSSLLQIFNAFDIVVERGAGPFAVGIFSLIVFGSIPIVLIIGNILKRDEKSP